MSTTAVPSSIRLVRAAIAASSGNGEASWRAKWCTRTKAPSRPRSSAATASSTLCTRASRPVRTCDPGMGCQCPKDRNPIRFSMPLMPCRALRPGRLFPDTTRPPAPEGRGVSRWVLLVLGERADALTLVLVGGVLGRGPTTVLALVLAAQRDRVTERVSVAGERDRVDEEVAQDPGAEREAEGEHLGVREGRTPLVERAVIGAAVTTGVARRPVLDELGRTIARP